MDNFLCTLMYLNNGSSVCYTKALRPSPLCGKKTRRPGRVCKHAACEPAKQNIVLHAQGERGENRSSCVKLVVWPPFVTGGVARLTGYQNCEKRN